MVQYLFHTVCMYMEFHIVYICSKYGIPYYDFEIRLPILKFRQIPFLSGPAISGNFL